MVPASGGWHLVGRFFAKYVSLFGIFRENGEIGDGGIFTVAWI